MFLDQRYKTWEEDALYQLKKYKVKYEGHIKTNYVFRIHGNRVMDLDNAVVGINDLLQKAGIIDNDKNIVESHEKKIFGHTEFFTTVEITKA